MNHGSTRNLTEWGKNAHPSLPCPSVPSVVPFLPNTVFSVVDFSFHEANPVLPPSVVATMLEQEHQTYAIRGAIFEVYKEIGPGFLESVYQECLEREFRLRAIPYERQVELRIKYKGVLLDQYFKADLVCFGAIIVELKACTTFAPVHRAQLLNYLRITGHRVGLLVNFHAHPKVEIERIVL